MVIFTYNLKTKEMKTVVELIIPIESNNRHTEYDEHRKAEYLACDIQSMFGIKPTCLFFTGELRIQFDLNQFEKIKWFHGRKWRSNVTHEVKRHGKMNGYSPNLRGMKIIEI
jgi:hypothetical protein